MRYHLFLCCAAVGLVAAVGANGQTPFSLSENFNSYAHLSTPTGWTCISNNAAYPPAVFTQDPAGWGMTVDYNATWTGPGRLNLIHPGQDSGGRAAAAWYNGLSADLKALIDKELKASVVYNNELTLKQENDMLEELKKLGMTVVQPDVAAFREAAKNIPAVFADKWGKDTAARLAAIK